MSELNEGPKLPDWVRLSPVILSAISNLAELEEEELRRVLRPHDDAGFGPGDEDVVRLREHLDEALGSLTRWEIACELGLYGESSTDPKVYPTASARGLIKLFRSDAFLRYLCAYLYFGVRILAGRVDPPWWWGRGGVGDNRESDKVGHYVNKRPLELAVPPAVGDVEKNKVALERFVALGANLSAATQQALGFLDGFHPDLKAGGSFDHNEPAEYQLLFDYNEPAEYELWLRGLRPDVQPKQQERFLNVARGMTEWARGRANFYMSLEPRETRLIWDVPEWVARRRPKDGWVITNPISARIALSDFYWLARLLRAEVSASGRVSYPTTSWMHVLRFQATLHKQDMAVMSLRDDEEVLRSVFDYVCDLVLNAVELSEERERKKFDPEEYPEPPRQVKHWRQVFDEELVEIKHQKDRREYTKPKTEPTSAVVAIPGYSKAEWSERLLATRDTRHRVGLAFSGGGIRSATFNLGVLQGLQELDLLRHVDYLSTVSGGGFIGSWFVGNVFRSRHWLGRRTCWDESIGHLRSYSNYLAPLTGILSADTWTMGVSWVRNAFLVQLSGLAWLFVILSAILIAMKGFLFAAFNFPDSQWKFRLWGHLGTLPHVAFLAALAAGLVLVSIVRSFWMGRADTGKHAPSTLNVLWLTAIPAWVGSFLLASMLWSLKWEPLPCCLMDIDSFNDYSKILVRVFQRLWPVFACNVIGMFVVGWHALKPLKTEGGRIAQSRLWRVVAGVLMSLLCTGVLYLELSAVVYLFRHLGTLPEQFGPPAFVIGPSLVLLSFTVSVVLWIGLSGRITSDEKREWWTRYGAWLTMVGVSGVTLSALTIFGPWLVVHLLLGKDGGSGHKGLIATIKWTSVLSWIGTIVGGLFAGNSSKTGDRQSRQSVPLDLLAKAGGFLFIVSFVVAAATTLYLFLAIWDTPAKGYWDVLANIHWPLLGGLLSAVVVIGIIFSWFFDINIFGLSRFYQYRLVRCYLGATRWKPGLRKPHPFTGFDRDDDLLLGSLKGSYSGPYPILNCTLNLAGSADLALNTRHSASFTLTPKYCGSDRPKVGYVQTGGEHGTDRFAGGVRLGQACAISGAAASPNMGYNTSPLVAFLLTMFNVRLGWWFPNPGQSAWSARGLHSSLYYLTRELLGIADEERKFLNVSDGGHFENLAIYELIRRRCTVIIAGDAECDELLQFGGLGNALRICGTDFGAQIEIDVKSIRARKEGHSLAHCAVGKIEYDNGSIGYLIYLKASVTGDEDPSVAQYRATHPSFPHESTADQFFSEDQFESYRKLGMHAVKHSFRGAQVGQQPLEVAEQMYDTLAPAGCPSEVFLKHTQTVERIWSEFRLAPGLATFLHELMLGPGGPVTVFTLTDEELCMGLELIQLMEEVFLDLQLDDFWEHPDNRGWAVMFMRWARSRRFQQVWNETRRTYGIRFEYFCAARLGLERDKPIVRI